MFTLLLLLSLYPSPAEWVSEWAQFKATGDALCVRACARTARRASPHLSPLIIWSNLYENKDFMASDILHLMDKYLYCNLFDRTKQKAISQNKKRIIVQVISTAPIQYNKKFTQYIV